MKFNISVLPTNIHTLCFKEIADSIQWALGELGHDVTRSASGQLAMDARNILFGVRPGDVVHVPVDPIIYNGEQVNKDGMWPSMLEIYKRYTIWDYSAANAARYKEWGLPEPRVVRPGYSEVLDTLMPTEKTYDVVFFGSMNARRDKILSELRGRGVKVLVVPFGVYGRERDSLIASAKLCLNIHYYESSIFEAVRCAYLAQNGVPVISESSVAGENTRWGISAVGYDSLVSFVCSALEGDLVAYGKSLAQAARNASVLDDVRRALEPPVDTTDEWARKLGADLAAAGESEYGPNYPSNQISTLGKRTALSITLCMIVKDEKDVIERCLASVKPFISRWSIVDTGSTDGTQDIIRKFMADTPGRLHECSWKEFDGSRSEAIDLARAECQNEGWLLQIDSDETLEVTGELELPDGYDCYDAWVTRGRGAVQWARPMFMRANKPWFYEMPRHEGLYSRTHAPTAPTPVHNALVMSTWEGARAKVGAMERFLNDAKVLEAWLPNHPGHTRCQYYIAQSYHCAATATNPPDRALLQKAVMNFLKRAEMPGGYTEETHSARLLAGNCMADLGYPWERVQQTWLQAYAIRPSRAESLYNIARYYRQQGDAARVEGRPSAPQYVLAELFARRAVLIGPPADKTPQFDPSVNDWRIKDELASALTYLNGHAEARELYRHCLRVPEISPIDRERIEINLQMCLQVAPDPA